VITNSLRPVYIQEPEGRFVGRDAFCRLDDASREDMEEILRQTTVFRGGPYLQLYRREIDGELLEYVGEANCASDLVICDCYRVGAFSNASPRELEVCFLLGNGLDSRDIGRKLWIRPRAVETHLQRIRERYAFRTERDLTVECTSRRRMVELLLRVRGIELPKFGRCGRCSMALEACFCHPLD
jgi:DNA-binding CsgD family transcriptional regulator